MLRFSTSKIIMIVAACLVGIYLVLPNLFTPEQRTSLEADAPRWFPKALLPTHAIVLGLDLQGGSHVLLEVDVPDLQRTQATALRDDVRRVLREAKVAPQGGISTLPRGVQVRLSGTDKDAVLPKLRDLANASAEGGLAQSSHLADIVEGEDGIIQLIMTDTGTTNRVRRAVDQAIEVLRRRVDALGTLEPNIQRQGADRILVQVPGLQDPQRLKDLLGKTAKLQFRLVSETASTASSDIDLLDSKDDPGRKIPVDRRVVAEGADLVDASPGFDQRTNEPIVNFRFNLRGSQRFGQATAENIGRPLAIVLDNEVISSPRIQSAITGGSGQISGRFTVQAANNLSILLRAGALPAKLTVVEERTVGPGLGQDSIQAGKYAAYLGTVLVVGFMMVSYGLFGLFANIALAIHVIFIFALMSLVGATLTLPGIAGIVLTIGTAVDSNVLIYERIREERRLGRSVIHALDAGFTRAFATIIDSNVTMFIAAAVLFFLGSGPVRGFAVTMVLGIITTVFTAVTMTRLMIAMWYRWKRPAHLPI